MHASTEAHGTTAISTSVLLSNNDSSPVATHTQSITTSMLSAWNVWNAAAYMANWILGRNASTAAIGIASPTVTATVNRFRSPNDIRRDAAMTAANGTRSFKGIGSDTVLTVPQATDQVAVSQAADVSVGAGTTSLSMTPTDTMDPTAAMSHGHAMLAAAVFGRFSDADAHTSTARWQAKTDTLALGFWNNTTTALSNQSTSSNMAIKL